MDAMNVADLAIRKLHELDPEDCNRIEFWGKVQAAIAEAITESFDADNQIVREHNAFEPMLEALKAIIQLLYYDKQAGHFALAHPDNFPTMDEDAVTDARAAIAKAEGNG